ncbi:glycosyltransferase 87 family protein [Microbacterium rhizomatis]|uniref:DUF2029 domain-containing protein n=1 Tax=Microbacterium rhizomatis TaxID=1631477 RepID=A0A5J5J849_9MICO|nr:glycosyltransferase 87 family protein [Microbacterium rhizomatis]KAA9111175.1 DUF2029 domain-containing protein [Microbacterium rhizomatis]
MSKRAILWVAFLVVHFVVAMLGWWWPNAPMGDVYLVYDPWSAAAVNGGVLDGHNVGIVGLTVPWVYPQLALLPMVLAKAFAWIGGYIVGWAILVTVVDALAFAMLVGKGRSNGRNIAAAFWLAFILLLGPVHLYRLDGFTVPIVLAGCLWLVGRPWLGASLLAIATWIKVWPAALIAAAFIAVRRRLAILGGVVAVSAVTLGTVIVTGGGAYAFGFISDQTGRGLQIEAPISTFYMWRAAFMLPDSAINYDPDMLTFQVTGPGLNVVIAIMTPLLALAVLSVAGLGAFKAWRRASFVSLFPALALGLVLAFIVFNKVGSPQYISWIAAPLAVGLVIDRRRWWKPAWLGLGIAVMTQAIYPLAYGGLMLKWPEPFSVLLLTIRNGLLVVLFVWAVMRLVRVPTRVPATAAPAPIEVAAPAPRAFVES